MPESPFRIELSAERLALYEALFRRSERIARMYLGARYALRDGLNPERFAAAAHCVRELMEKVPEIVAVSTPAHSERLGAKVGELEQSDAVITHDAEAQLSRIAAPTLITFGRHDVATSTRFADRMKGTIRNSELLIFDGCAHAPIYESVEEFNDKTLQFLTRHAARIPSASAGC